MIASIVLPPALILVAGALLTTLFQGRALRIAALAAPLVGLLLLWAAPEGNFGQVSFLGLNLLTTRIDALSRIFGYVFYLACLLGVLFSFHHKERSHYAVGLLYAGAAQGVTFAGDLITLFVFWETLTLAATFLIAARRTRRSREAAVRYMLVHVAGGLCLLSGILLHRSAGGDLALGALQLDAPGAVLIFLGFGLNCAWPLLHAWLVDAYPESTVAGAVFLSVFTTKSAVYVLARCFAGIEELVWIGALMAAFPVLYALIENDLRRVLCYSLISQVGYMVVAIGIGSDMAINGAVCHAFAHILYKSLLFMVLGAVVFRTGTSNASQLGGLYRSMPGTVICCLVGSASISAFPLFSGFVTKSIIMDAVTHSHRPLVWLVLTAASVGTFFYAGVKIPYRIFFGAEAKVQIREAPPHMLLAMAATAFLCVLLGLRPQLLFGIMPYPAFYELYTPAHVLSKLQLLCFAGLGFWLLCRWRIYPFEKAATNLDVDWFYRRGGLMLYRGVDRLFNGLNAHCERFFITRMTALSARFFEEPGGNVQIGCLRILNRLMGFQDLSPGTKQRIRQRSRLGTYPVGVGVLLAVIFLAATSLLYFIA